ncbi:helix-turn-helix domain-containing protein [Natronorubrum aibiense]|uniref:PhiH1 repressor n=1 Tax=Natronorubrum aibiense TaxID=348826 RepID=A0A5P9P5G0_9EURY|nr:helix-turn-helix domain-containing protein [Natronorubrum aibiense]QFU83368.1 PhiH1 repressor [Natronorubrum aibiense]
MRQSGTWMTIWDDRILEIIRDEDAGRVGDLTERDAIRISPSSVSRRCKKLAEHGLLTPLGNGVYTISDRGEAYLDEEYDAENEVYLNGNGANNGPTASQTSES